MKEIPLTRGKTALVDDKDFARVSLHTWHCDGHGYAVTNIPHPDKPRRQKALKMHRLIMGLTDPAVWCDHKNLNRCDNQRDNLRVTNGSGNAANAPKRKGRTEFSSRFKGVHWYKANRKWGAQIREGGKRVHLGLFLTDSEAAAAYDFAAKRAYGEFARLNFA